VTLEGLPISSSMISFHVWQFKKLIHACKTIFTCWVSLFCNGFLPQGSTAEATLVYNLKKLYYNFPYRWPIYHTISVVDIKLMVGPLRIMHLVSQGSWEWKLLWAQCQTFIVGYLIFLGYILLGYILLGTPSYILIHYVCLWRSSGLSQKDARARPRTPGLLDFGRLGPPWGCRAGSVTEGRPALWCPTRVERARPFSGSQHGRCGHGRSHVPSTGGTWLGRGASKTWLGRGTLRCCRREKRRRSTKEKREFKEEKCCSNEVSQQRISWGTFQKQ